MFNKINFNTNYYIDAVHIKTKKKHQNDALYLPMYLPEGGRLPGITCGR